MKHLSLFTALLGATIFVSLAGCGSDNREGSVTPQVQASQSCIACHISTLSPVTGNSIVTEYLVSGHATIAGGPDCNSCHQVGGHPDNGTIPAIPNDLICITCHTVTVPMSTKSAHFANISASYLGGPQSRLARTLINPATGNPSSSSCNGCHNPHDVTSLLPVNQQWATSGHAATTDDAFKESSTFIKSSPCSRCHSATGFRYYMTNKQTIISKAILGQYSSAKEVISCNACHTDYSWNRISSDPRTANQLTGFVPPNFVIYSTPYLRFANVGKYFPGTLNNPTLPVGTATRFDVGDTNLCIACHGGREGRSGASITSASTSVDPHYFPAAGVMFMKIGFIDFTSQDTVLPAVPAVVGPPALTAIAASTYGRTLISSEDIGTGSTTGGVTSTHRKLGTTAIRGDSHNPSFFVPGNLDSGGPCVVCHMTAGHTWEILPDTYNKVCINCHASERGVPLNANNFLSAFVDENRDQMDNALALAVKLLETNYDITVRADAFGHLLDLEEPQEAAFYRLSTGATMNAAGWAAYVTAGQPGAALTATQLLRLKGAMFNIAIGYRDNASFVHARTYMRRLIYDSIDWLDDGIINMSVGTTALGPLGQSIVDTSGLPVFGKGATAFIGDSNSPIAAGTTPAMTYIIGFDRTTGAWTPPQRERP